MNIFGSADFKQGIQETFGFRNSGNDVIAMCEVSPYVFFKAVGENHANSAGAQQSLEHGKALKTASRNNEDVDERRFRIHQSLASTSMELQMVGSVTPTLSSPSTTALGRFKDLSCPVVSGLSKIPSVLTTLRPASSTSLQRDV